MAEGMMNGYIFIVTVFLFSTALLCAKAQVNGGFTEWSSWTTCSVTCAGGSQSRNRTCTNPPPQYGGANCTGTSTQRQDCNTQACPEIELGQPCTGAIDGDKCRGQFADCISRTCQCISGYYRNGNQCLRKIELGDTGCSTSVGDSCMSDYATCYVDRGSCTCNSGYYDSNGNERGGTCTRKIELGDTGCSISVGDSCMSDHATCQSNGSCICNDGYYDNNGNQHAGTCAEKKILGKTCSNILNECAQTNAECLDNKCTCGLQFFDTNGLPEGGNCESVSKLRVERISFAAVTTSGFTVNWTPPSATEALINKYVIVWSPKTQDNSLSGGSKEVHSGSRSLEINTGVTAGKTYRVEVRSVNTQTRQGHTRTASLSDDQALKPNMPSSLTTSDLDARDKSISVGWKAPSSGVATSYNIKLFDDSAELTTQATQSNSAVIYYQHMLNGYHYDVKILARSEAYQSSKYEWSDVYVEPITTVVQKPSAPRNVGCEILKDESITLKWSKPLSPNGDLVRYNIEVLNATGQHLFSTNTAEVIEEHKVNQLKPGTTYMFKVYTQNVMYNSSEGAISPSCTTQAKLSDPPNNFQTTEVTSRNISIKWSEPINSYSKEIIGYVIQLKENSRCIEEIVYKCLTPSCRSTFEPSSLDNMCNSNVRNIRPVNNSQLSGFKSYTFANLLPDTSYTIIGAVVNFKGVGNTVELSNTTKEEAPQNPYNVDVKDIDKTSLTVIWDIADPRPGKTNYTVSLATLKPAESKEITVSGFSTRECKFDNLEEYWNYSATVTASTSVASKTSVQAKQFRTLPAAPGQVSDPLVTTNPGGNYSQMKISWKSPDILKQNSIIKSYTLMYYQEQKRDSTSDKSFDHQIEQSYTYEILVTVVPEQSYIFEVYAVNEQNMTGEIYSEIKEAPAGVPINIEKTQNISIIPTDKVKKAEETKFTVSLVQEFFMEATYGAVRGTGLIICSKKDCEPKDKVKTLEQFNSMKNWKEDKAAYRSTNDTWLNQLMKDNPKSRRKRAVTNLDYTVGSDTCPDLTIGQYCNGPLQPGKSYYIFAVSCTNGGCLLSKPNGPFITKAAKVIEDCNCSTQTAVVGTILGVVNLILLVYAGYITRIVRQIKAKGVQNIIKNRNEGHVSHMNESFGQGLSAVLNERNDQHPESDTKYTESEYAALENRNMGNDTTYESLRLGQ